MNKETQLLIDFLNKSGFYLDKVIRLKSKYSNIKDFQYHLGYVIMDIVSTNKEFFNLNRKNIEIDKIAQELF